MKRKRDGEFLQLFNLPITLPSFWKLMQDHLRPYQCIVSFYLMIQTVCQASKSQMLVQWCTETCCWGQIFKIRHETMSLHLLPDNRWMPGNQVLGCKFPPEAWPGHPRWHRGGTRGAPARSPTIRPGRVSIPPRALLLPGLCFVPGVTLQWAVFGNVQVPLLKQRSVGITGGTNHCGRVLSANSHALGKEEELKRLYFWLCLIMLCSLT